MKFSTSDADTLRRIQLWRRDVRHFMTDAVPDDVLGRLQEAMDMAPSVGNAKPWRVVRVVDPQVRHDVRCEFERSNTQAASDYQDQQQIAYRSLKLAGLDTAPVQLAIFTAVDPDAGHRLGRRTMPATLHQSVAMAIYAVWLAARAENLGLGMVSILDPERMKTILNVGPEWDFAAYLCIGWPEFADDTPLLHRSGWQANSRSVWEVR